jgi:hypothetical protein
MNDALPIDAREPERLVIDFAKLPCHTCTCFREMPSPGDAYCQAAATFWSAIVGLRMPARAGRPGHVLWDIYLDGDFIASADSEAEALTRWWMAKRDGEERQRRLVEQAEAERPGTPPGGGRTP